MPNCDFSKVAVSDIWNKHLFLELRQLASAIFIAI